MAHALDRPDVAGMRFPEDGPAPHGHAIEGHGGKTRAEVRGSVVYRVAEVPAAYALHQRVEVFA